jgi:hypothetical protein
VPSSLILPVQGPSVQDAPRRDALEPGPAALQTTSSSPGVPAPIQVETLQGWHLPLLDDPAFLPLQPLLQRSLLLAVPDRVLTALRRHRPLTSQALVALESGPGGQQQILGLIVCRRLNRSGSSWQVEHLRLPIRSIDPVSPGRLEVSTALLREAIHRARSAASWFATASSIDRARLALLREQGFQPQRTDQLWRWRPAAPVSAPLPAGLQLLRLHRGTAPLLWHLEQATCPAHLRQLLDRSIEDLLDQSGSRGWMLFDAARQEAVAAVRWLADRPDGGHRVELSVHPLWQHLLGSPCERLLQALAAGGSPLWLTSEVGDRAREQWLRGLGADPQQEEVLMARSVWRRQGASPTRLRVARLGAVLEQFQPRRQPLPTPVGRVFLR